MNTSFAHLPLVRPNTPQSVLECFERQLESVGLGNYILQADEFGPKVKEPRLRRLTLSAHSSFVDDQNLKVGREASLNDVRFGRLKVVPENAKSGDATELVAIKPYVMSRSPSALLREYAMTNYVNSIPGRRRSFAYLGLARRVDGAYQGITVFEESVRTYEDVLWATGKKAESTTEEQVSRAISDCVYSLGYLAGLGIYHGDTRPKNLARDRKGIRFVDFEESYMLEHENGLVHDSSENVELIHEDIETFIDACVGLGDIDELVIRSFTRYSAAKSMRNDYLRGMHDSGSDGKLTIPQKIYPTKRYFSEALDSAIQK